LPSLFRVGGYHIYFWSNENDEPVHVHVCRGKPTANATKVWLTAGGGCVVAHNNSRIPSTDLNKLMGIIAAQFSLICDSWKKHFVVDLVKFYC